MARIALVLIYLLGILAAVALLDANIGAGWWVIAIWTLASVLLGWGTGRLSFALLAFLAIPIAVPFGYPNDYAYSEPLAIWWAAAFLACCSACLIFVTALASRIAEERRQHRASS